MARVKFAVALAVVMAVVVGVPAQAAAGRTRYVASYPSLDDCVVAGAVRQGDEGWWDYECRPDGSGTYALYAVYYP